MTWQEGNTSVKNLIQRTVLWVVLMATMVGVAAVPTPAQADHAWTHGYWTRAPYVAWDGQYAANIQDGAYYWQDRGFVYGYVPPLPGYNHGGSACTNVWDRYINVCTVAQSIVQSYGGTSGYSHMYRYADGSILGAYILVADNLSPELRQAVWRHEFGHAIGMGHTAGSDCVMYGGSTLVLGETCRHDWDTVDEMY